MVLIEILNHVIEQHRLFLLSPVTVALKDHTGIVLKPLLYTVRAAHNFMIGLDTQYLKVPKDDPFRDFIELPSTNKIMTMTSN